MEPPTSNAQAAAQLQVGKASVKRAKVVIQNAIPDLIELVEAAEVPLRSAEDVARLSHDEQRELVESGAEAVRLAAAEIRRRKQLEKGQEAADKEPAPKAPPKPQPASRKRNPIPPTHEHVDEVGAPIPKHLRDIWYDPELKNTIEEIKGHLAGLQYIHKQFLRSLSKKPYKFCHFGHASGKFESVTKEGNGFLAHIIAHLEAGIPYAVCQKCLKEKPPEGEKCSWCRSTGLLPRWRFEEIKRDPHC